MHRKWQEGNEAEKAGSWEVVEGTEVAPARAVQWIRGKEMWAKCRRGSAHRCDD